MIRIINSVLNGFSMLAAILLTFGLGYVAGGMYAAEKPEIWDEKVKKRFLAEHSEDSI